MTYPARANNMKLRAVVMATTGSEPLDGAAISGEDVVLSMIEVVVRSVTAVILPVPGGKGIRRLGFMPAPI